jgi:RNA polymerase sigma-70 factor (ECF subfamily)
MMTKDGTPGSRTDRRKRGPWKRMTDPMDKPTQDDPDLADAMAAAAGDEAAFARIVRRRQGEIGRQMWHFTRDRTDHESLVQEVFVGAFLSLPRYRGTAPVMHWLRRIATRTGYQYWKRQTRRRGPLAALETAWSEHALRAVDGGEPSEAAGCLFELLRRLPDKDRLVLTLIYFEECSMAEAAERTGWSVTLVKVRAFRARHRLRVLLEEAGYGPKKH